jgi:hypothetical protein
MGTYNSLMVEEKNQLLGYTIDKFLKVFNPNQKEMMNKFHFCKLMNLLDDRLQHQGIDIKLPGYWYKFGFFTEERFLDSILPYLFSENCMRNGCIYPSKIKVDYTGKVSIREADRISKTIDSLYNQYGWKKGYGDLAKKESYEINSPYKFNTIFQGYLSITDKNVSHLTESLKLDIITNLDELLSEFPINSFPELASIHFEWDDTTRVVLDYAPDAIKLELIRRLRDVFWEIYPKRVRIDCNWNLPEYAKREWVSAYEGELLNAEKTIEDMRNTILFDYYTPSEENKKVVKMFMQDIYNIPY